MAVHLQFIFGLAVLYNVAAQSSINLEGFYPGTKPQVEEDDWWGPDYRIGFNDTSIRPFHIHFDYEMIEDLRYRLRRHRHFSPPLEGANFRYGFNSDHVDCWLDFWAEKYPFEDREIFLNQFPQYKTNIQGLDIYFIWVRPQVPPGIEVVPVLMMHGWPGSVREFFDVIKLITHFDGRRDFAVEVIVPSLPGFGYSDSAVRKGLGGVKTAVLMRKLMHRLGFKKYFIQGGDLGRNVGDNMATLYPEEVIGFHTNFGLATVPAALLLQFLAEVYPPLIVESELADRMYPTLKILGYLLEESGYFHEQSTKPDTLGFSLSDSPAGLLTYVLEKFSTGTNRTFRDLPDGALTSFDPVSMIDNLMMYWAPNAMTTAMRFYAESFNKKNFAYGVMMYPTPVPTWVIQAKYEVVYQPPTILKFKYPNLLNASALNFGGHFLAFELPELFTNDVLLAIEACRKWQEENKDQSFANKIQENIATFIKTVSELLRRAAEMKSTDFALWKIAQWYLTEIVGFK